MAPRSVARHRVDRPAHRLRAVVTDVDGTLTDARRRLDPRAMEVVHRLTDRRIPVLLATGNVLPVALGLHRSLGLSTPIVAENGGLLYWPRDERVERLADPAIARKALAVLRRRRIPVQRLFTDRWRESEVALAPTVPIARVRAALAELPVVVEGTGYAIHLMARGSGKLPALRRALRPYRLAPEDCLVLGDGDNDMGMLAAAGWSVSFPNGSPGARAAADYVTRAKFARGFVEGVRSGSVLRSRV